MRYPRENRRFIDAWLLLSTIQENPERLDLVHEIQRIIIRRLFRCEKRIKYLQKAKYKVKKIKSTGYLSKAKSRALKEFLVLIENRIVEVRDLMFLWRCFGDGVAAIYQSKYSLKHLFYDHNYNVKQDAGAITGKEGFRLEYKIFITLIKQGIPAVMSDLTNIIRHGDVCLLAGEDPFPIEVKSSKNLSKRAKRQIEQISAISNFYKNDGAPVFRGMPNVIRAELKGEEVNYFNEINDCMAVARESGVSIAYPEDGIIYIAYRHDITEEDQRLHDVLNKCSRTSLLVSLTPDERWLPLYPFTLSMRAHNLIDFMQEEIGVVVIIDLGVVKKTFHDHGMCATAIMDGTHSFQICKDPEMFIGGVVRVSEQIFLRVALEFQSITWFVQEHASTIFPSISTGADLNNASAIMEIPESWFSVKDCYLE